MKDDAIAQLSDQLVALSARLQELEKTHNTVFNECTKLPFILVSGLFLYYE